MNDEQTEAEDVVDPNDLGMSKEWIEANEAPLGNCTIKAFDRTVLLVYDTRDEALTAFDNLRQLKHDAQPAKPKPTRISG